jgi:hypothetical protein
MTLHAGVNRQQQMATMAATPEALHGLGSFGTSTSLSRMHRILAQPLSQPVADGGTHFFNVVEFFSASTAAIDFLLSFAKGLASSEPASV